MTWSTRQLADLAGVTLRSIRHWHEVQLLPEPERSSNGYKQYTARHLVLALRIARLASLGFRLDQIATMLDSEEQGRDSLRGLRSEIDTRINELTRIRHDIDELITLGLSPDLSPEALLAMEALGSDPASRNVAILLARLLPKDDMPVFVEAMRTAPDTLGQLNAELAAVPADSSEEQLRELAERGITLVADFLAERGEALPPIDSQVSEDIGAAAMTAIIDEHLNSAQQRVMTLIIDGLTRLAARTEPQAIRS